jgi:uncharacterized protein (TIGR02246 family)
MKKALLIMMTAISTAAFAQSTPDEQAIHKVVSTMESGWVQKSGETFASVFAENHDFVVWNGYYFPNSTRKQTAASHQGLFNGPFRTFDIRLKIDKIRFIRPDLALVHVIGVGYTKGEAIPQDPGVLMEKKDGNWKILSFHNLDLETFTNKEIGDRSPVPLKVMYASWYKN